jgi:hypothetical protein
VVVQILEGPDRGRSFNLKEGDNRLGRSAESEVALPDKTVSGSHATITIAAGVATIRDHSKNGTWVNGRRITDARLAIGDRVKVGLTELRLASEPMSVDAPTVIATEMDRTKVRPPVPPSPQPAPKKKEDSGPYRAAAPSDEETKRRAAKAAASKKSEGKKAESKQKPGKARRLILVAVLGLVVVIAAMVFMTPQKPRRPGGHPPPQPPPPPRDTTGKVVDVDRAWTEVNLAALAPDVKQQLEHGKELYDHKIPGNAFNAVIAWKEAVRNLQGNDAGIVNDCIFTVAREVDAKFRQDSSDFVILRNSGRDREAAMKLDRITLDIPDPADRRYSWAKNLLINGGFARHLGR